MTTEIGWVALGVIPSFKDFGSKLERGTAGEMSRAGISGGAKYGDAAGKSMSGRFVSHVKSAGKVAALGLAGVGAVAFSIGRDAVAGASDLAESTNKLQQVFGDASGRIERFASRAAKSMGQTNIQAREAAATFGIFGKVANLTDRQNAKFSKRMTRLASDLASFHNTSPDEAIEALGAALRGEAEPIRKYGVLLDEATLKAEALNIGLLKPVKDQAKIKTYQVAILEGQQKYNDALKEHGKDSIEALKAEAALGTARDRLAKATAGTIPPLTQQQKVMAAQSVILKQTKDAQGDFARTSDGLANQQRILSARWEDAKTSLGEVLLPVVNDAVKFLNQKGIPSFERFADWFKGEGVDRIKDFAGKVRDAAGDVKDLVGWLEDLPKPAKYAGLVALLGAVGGTKLRGGALGGKGGALGTIGSALGITKPVPVFVTNKSFGVPGADGPGKTKVPFLALSATTAAITAGNIASIKANEGNGVELGATAPGAAGSGLNLPKGALDFSDSNEQVKQYDKSLAVINNAWAKIGKTTDGARESVVLYDGTVRRVPTLWSTAFSTPGLLREKLLVEQYGSLLDGLDNRTITTFFRSVTQNNDTGEGGGGVVPGRSPSGPGVQINHYGDIKSDSPRDYLRNTNQIARHRNGGGVPIP